MTTAAAPPRARWRVVLLAALTVVLALLLPTTSASATAPPAAETRVGAFHPATTVVVGVHACITAGQRPVRGPSQPQIAAGSCVAAEAGTGALNLPFKSPELRSQVGNVVRHFDEFGAPPPGVAQGGLKGFPQGTYGNKSGALPQREMGYYTESDIWQSGNGVKRGADRLIFGRDGEVWFTPNHYDSFVRIR